jgi:hypothetical protein
MSQENVEVGRRSLRSDSKGLAAESRAEPLEAARRT